MLGRLSDDLLNISKRALELTPLKSRTIKIAITGLSRSGKSVFITSFIDQLLHSQNLFANINGAKGFDATLLAPKTSMTRFDYYHFVKQIKNEHIWCDSTDSISSVLLKVQTKGGIPFISDSDFYIEIVDYPGEWLLDLTLLDKSYEQWSADVLKHLENLQDEKAKEYVKRVRNLTTNDSSSELEISLHGEYSQMINELKEKHYSFITPGRFLVPSDLRDDPMLVFAPLPKSSSKLHEKFKKRYKTYVKEIVKKIHLEYFKDFDRQVVLVDVIEALQNGYECYADMDKSLKSMLGVYSHAQGTLLSRILSPTIEKVCFVATKADLVPSSSHRNYLSLLNEMSGKIQHELEGIEVSTSAHVVSSVKCTQSIVSEKNGEKLPSLRGIDAKTQNVVEVYPGNMPSMFPTKESWDSSLFMYEEFLPPKKQYHSNEAFEHINMDRLIWDLLKDML